MSAYDEWPRDLQDFWDEGNIPGLDQPDVDDDYIEGVFDLAFGHTADEYEAMGYSEDDINAAREEFFDYLGIDASDFDWEGWREAMGYE